MAVREGSGTSTSYRRSASITVDGVAFDPLTEAEVVSRVRDETRPGAPAAASSPPMWTSCAGPPGSGASATILDQASHRGGRRHAGGLGQPPQPPAGWASPGRSARRALPERVAGASLVWSLCAACALDGRRVYFVGGAPGSPGVPSGAQRAAAVLGVRNRGLRVAGCASPPYGFEEDPDQWAAIRDDVVEAKPDLVLVGIGFPKQERLINDLRPELPGAWFLGCGASINFVVGDQRGLHSGCSGPGWSGCTGWPGSPAALAPATSATTSPTPPPCSPAPPSAAPHPTASHPHPTSPPPHRLLPRRS